jgi:hypothetical protein
MKKYIFALISIFAISIASCKQTSSPEVEVTEVDTTAIRIDSTNIEVDTADVKADTLK